MMSRCVSHWTVKSLASLCTAVPLGIALVFASAEPTNAQFADTASPSQPAQMPQEQTSKVQADEGIQPLGKAGRMVVRARAASWAIAQFTPTPDPSDPNNPLPTTAS